MDLFFSPLFLFFLLIKSHLLLVEQLPISRSASGQINILVSVVARNSADTFPSATFPCRGFILPRTQGPSPCLCLLWGGGVGLLLGGPPLLFLPNESRRFGKREGRPRRPLGGDPAFGDEGGSGGLESMGLGVIFDRADMADVPSGHAQWRDRYQSPRQHADRGMGKGLD